MTDSRCTGLSLAVLEIDEKQVNLLATCGFNSIDAIVEFLEESIGCGAFLPLSYYGVPLTEVDFDVILTRLKVLGCWPDVTKLEDIPLDQLKVSDDCRKSLRQSGFFRLHEMVWGLEQLAIGGPMFEARWLKYHEEIFSTLRKIGAWGNCRQPSE